MQAPLWHESVWVHMLPSLQLVPLVAFVAAAQAPVDVLQIPTT